MASERNFLHDTVSCTNLDLNFVVLYLVKHAQDAASFLHCYFHNIIIFQIIKKKNEKTLHPPPVELINGSEEQYICDRQKQSLHLSVTGYRMVPCPSCGGEYMFVIRWTSFVRPLFIATLSFFLTVMLNRGQLCSASISRWENDPGCGWSCDHL